MQQLGWMIGMGIPLVGLVHVGMGSFLALQAYYGSTFVDGTGAVVGVGLLRNLATLMTGLTLSGLLSVRIIPELRAIRNRSGSALTTRTASRPELDPWGGELPESSSSEGLVHLVAPRILAALIACPVLAFWGAVVGTLIGWQSADALVRLPSEMYFLMFLRMIWFRDIVGLIGKGMIYGVLIGAITSYEAWYGGTGGLAEPSEDGTGGDSTLGRSIFRATCLSMVAILLANMSWFMLAYHAVPIYGPTLLKPPGA
jgi:phospholipid/cholesterol/gamma-HCH transport system permease protein